MADHHVQLDRFANSSTDFLPSRINNSCEPNACYNNNGCLEKEALTKIWKVKKSPQVTSQTNGREVLDKKSLIVIGDSYVRVKFSLFWMTILRLMIE